MSAPQSKPDLTLRCFLFRPIGEMKTTIVFLVVAVMWDAVMWDVECGGCENSIGQGEYCSKSSCCKGSMTCQYTWGTGPGAFKRCMYPSGDTMNYEVMNNEPQDHMHQDDDLNPVRRLEELVNDEGW